MAYDPSDPESFDVDEVKALRKSTANNQPSNPYIRQGMGVLNFVNDFNPAVALAKTADNVTSDVNKGNYGGALGTLALETVMSNPAAKAIGKVVKKVRGVPKSSYGGPLSDTPTFGISHPDNKFGKDPVFADNLMTRQARARGYDIPEGMEYLYRGQKYEEPFKKGDVFFGAEPIVAGDYGKKVYAIPYDPKKFDVNKYLSPERISNFGKYPNAHGQPQWIIPDTVVSNLQKESGMPTMMIDFTDNKFMDAINNPIISREIKDKVPIIKVIE